MYPTPDSVEHGTPEPKAVRRLAKRFLLIFVALAFVLFWTWALFFASKEGVNVIEDRAWAERAETICFAATE